MRMTTTTKKTTKNESSSFMQSRHDSRGQRRLRRVGFAMVLALGMSGSAFASDRTASQENVLEDWATAVNVEDRTIQLGDERYRVGAGARLFDAKGRRLRMGELSIGPEGRMVKVVFRRGEAGVVREIKSLRILDGDFE